MSRYAGFLLRLLMLAVFWWSVAVIIHFSSVGARPMFPGGGGGFPSLIVAFVVIVGAGFVLTERLLRIRVGFGVQKEKPKRRKAAVEPEALRLQDMIALLDEDDLDDLRAEVREGLRDHIRNLTAGETETFEALLSDSKRKRR